MTWTPCVTRRAVRDGELRYELGHPLVDRYLAFVAGRARPNTLRAVVFDLKAFFTIVAKDPVEVTAADVFEFVAAQRGAARCCAWSTGSLRCRAHDRAAIVVGVGLLYVVARGDTPVSVNPVPRGPSTRRRCGSKRSPVGPVGAGAVDAAEDPLAPRGRPAERAAHASGPGHGSGDGIGRPAPLRSTRPAPRGPLGR
jgi:integrase/recombinase XerD